ncbi:cysteine peptidase family C39 domain-containing protein, partial [Acinetobacter baumannii]
IMQFHGRKVSLNKLRRDYAISLRGSTLKSIMDIASELQLHSRALKLEVGDLDRLQCPAILHWDMNHYVVLKKVSGNTATIHDPAVG